MGATRDSVAKKAGGVSSATVSRVYNNPPGQVSPPSLAKRVLEAASELGGMNQQCSSYLATERNRHHCLCPVQEGGQTLLLGGEFG